MLLTHPIGVEFSVAAPSFGSEIWQTEATNAAIVNTQEDIISQFVMENAKLNFPLALRGIRYADAIVL